MNGLTRNELRELARIRSLAATDLSAAKRAALTWMARADRRVLRRAAARTVRGIFAHLKEEGRD